MRDNAILLVAEDDDGHFSLMEKNLLRSGLSNKVIRFTDGQQTLDFLKKLKDPTFIHAKHPCLLILDIRMPKIDGLDILQFVKSDEQLKKIPVIILTTAGNPSVVDKCRQFECNMFIVKPVVYEEFVDAMTQLGHFLSIVEVPAVFS